MAEAILPARGFRDILPAEKAKREAIIASIRRSYSQFGFTEIETPAMEPLERLSSNQGGENEKLVFRVLRRGLPADDSVRVGDACDLGLRYDLTVPLVRYYASHAHELPRVFRALQIGPVWRAERPQKGRYRQFLQCDIDILGEPSIVAEVELISATLYALTELGIADTTVRLNDRRILDSLLAVCGVDEEARARTLITIDKLDKIGVGGVSDALAESGLPAEAVAEIRAFLERFDALAGGGFREVADLLPAGIDPEGLRAVEEIAAAVIAGSPDSRVVFDPTLVRGMGYYTGPIFEVAHAGSTSSICGGGRYDAMGKRVFGRDVAASGFSIGFERIVGLVSDERFADQTPLLAVVYNGTSAVSLARVQSHYVRAGRRVMLVKKAKNTSKQLSDLAEQGVTHFCLVEGDVAPDAIEERPLAR